MSLDLYFIAPEKKKILRGTGIYVRENGKTVELSIEEAKKRWPDWKPDETLPEYYETDEAWWGNMTHNLGRMARQVVVDQNSGLTLYDIFWHPGEHGLARVTKRYLEYVKLGRDTLIQEGPDAYRKFEPEADPETGKPWGTYENLVDFCNSILETPEELVLGTTIHASI